MTKTKESHSEKIKPKEIEATVLKLAKSGISPEKIGLILRDQHGIPKAKMFGKKICQILSDSKQDLVTNTEYKNIKSKIENLKKHFEKNKHDYYAQRKISQHSSRIRKLSHPKIIGQ
jgi:small subunit ribosomal protein S15